MVAVLVRRLLYQSFPFYPSWSNLLHYFFALYFVFLVFFKVDFFILCFPLLCHADMSNRTLVLTVFPTVFVLVFFILFLFLENINYKKNPNINVLYLMEMFSFLCYIVIPYTSFYHITLSFLFRKENMFY